MIHTLTVTGDYIKDIRPVLSKLSRTEPFEINNILYVSPYWNVTSNQGFCKLVYDIREFKQKNDNK